MRIVYVSHVDFPATATNTQQTFWTALEVARRGVEVTLRVPHRSGPVEPNPTAVIAEYYGVSAAALPSTLRIVRHGRRLRPTALNEVWFDWESTRDLSSGSGDLIWTRDSLALLWGLRRGLPMIFETYRPDFANRPAFAWWRRSCLRHPLLRGLILHSRLAADAYVNAGVPPDRCLVAHNGFAPALFGAPLTRDAARTRLGLNGERPLVLYAGHAGRWKGMPPVVELAAAVPAAQFVLLGVAPDSEDGRALLDLARRAGADNLVLRPWVPLSQVPDYLWSADCLLIPPTDAPLRRFRRTVLPMKIFMYLAAGRPILAPRLPDVEEILVDGDNARLVPPDDVGAAAAALRALLADAALQSRLSGGALESAARYTWEARARALVPFLERVTAR